MTPKMGAANMQQVSDITYSSPLAPVNGAKNGKEHAHSGATGMLTLQGHLVILPAQFAPPKRGMSFLASRRSESDHNGSHGGVRPRWGIFEATAITLSTGASADQGQPTQ